MATATQSTESLRESPTEPAATRLLTFTGNRFPRKCAYDCGLGIPCDRDNRCPRA